MAVTEEAPTESAAGDGWRVDKNGKEYIPRATGRKGINYRVGEESVAEAVERDSRPRDERPRRSKTTTKKPPPPPSVDLKELERELVDALSAPSFIAATFGDEWSADHFTRSAPVLARNLIVASEHNPWLRRKLEAASTGGDLMMGVISMIGVAGALVGYAVPPLIFWLNLPVPEKAREMWGIPERRDNDVDPDARRPPPPPEAAFAAAA